jgi:limonene-1,2-epoxide hydrolase
MPDNAKIVSEFLALWHEPGGWRLATNRYFHENGVYENIGMSRSEGIDEILDFVGYFERTTGNGWMVVEMKAIAEAGSFVLTERIDHVMDGEGKLLMSSAVMGAFELKDGKIVAWRDYFDTGSLDAPYGGPGALVS